MPKPRLPALVVAAALVAAGCGGSSHPPQTTTTASVTKASFLAQLNSLCNRANAAYGAAKTQNGQVAVIGHYLVVFKSVKVPSDLQATYSQYVSVLAQELAKLAHGDSSGLSTLAQTKARPLAVKLGATACANPH